MAANVNPATMGGARVVAKAAKLATTSIHENGSHRERDLDYRGVIAVLGDGWRVIECRDGLQWIIQRRDAGDPHRAHWRGVSFHLSREALIAASGRLCAAPDPAALAILAALPAHHAEGAHHV